MCAFISQCKFSTLSKTFKVIPWCLEMYLSKTGNGKKKSHAATKFGGCRHVTISLSFQFLTTETGKQTSGCCKKNMLYLKHHLTSCWSHSKYLIREKSGDRSAYICICIYKYMYILQITFLSIYSPIIQLASHLPFSPVHSFFQGIFLFLYTFYNPHQQKENRWKGSISH